MTHICVIRVVLSFEQAQRIDCEGFLDLMSRAGIIKLHRNDKSGACFDFLPPQSVFDEGDDIKQRGSDSRRWATKEAARLEGHGFNAVCAPEWKDGDIALQDQKLVIRKYNLGANAWCGCGHPHSFDMCDRLNCHPKER